MEANYRTADGRVTFKVAGANVKELFGSIADLQAIFEAESHCRLCNTPNPRFAVRPVDKGDYYELHCSNPECGGRFDFGQLADGSNGLFPKRKDKDKNPLPDGGWYIYPPRTQQRQAPPVPGQRSERW